MSRLTSSSILYSIIESTLLSNKFDLRLSLEHYIIPLDLVCTRFVSESIDLEFNLIVATIVIAYIIRLLLLLSFHSQGSLFQFYRFDVCFVDV
jgi:hypothetical protein